MNAVLSVQGASAPVKKKSFFSKFTRLNMLRLARAVIPAAVLMMFFPQLAMAAGSSGQDLMASGNTTVKATFGKDSSVVKWVVLAEVLVGAVMYPDQFLPLQRDMIGKFGAAKDQWFSSFLLQVENHSSWHRLFVDPLSRAMYSSDGPDFEFVQQKRKEGLSIHEAVWQLAWKKSGPEMASLEAWLEEHEKYRSVA